MVNNAGISMRDNFDDLDFSMIEQMMNVNCTSQISAISSALPFLKQRPKAQIVNVLTI
jgi:short-subunit dehydrogenase